MSLGPYVFFNGTARQALERYAEIFGSEAPVLMDANGMPPEFDVPPERRKWIMHGHVDVAGGVLMASDSIMEPSAPMAGCSVQVSLDTAAEAKCVFDQLAEGGEVTMAWAPTFWSAGFGMLTDAFGVRWMVNCEEPPLTA